MSAISRISALVFSAIFSVAIVSNDAHAAIVLSDPNPSVSSGNWAKVVDPAYPAAGLYVINVGNSHSWYSANDPTSVIATAFAHSEVANVYWGVGSRYTADTVTPSVDGAIQSIDWNVEARGSGPDQTKVALLLIQGGKYYRSSFLTVATQGYVNYSDSGLTAADFGEFVGKAYDYATPADGTANFSSNPDFSASGGEIQFGFLAHMDPSTVSPASGDSLTAYQLVRSWSATITPVPEPTAVALLAAALPLAMRRRRA